MRTRIVTAAVVLTTALCLSLTSCTGDPEVSTEPKSKAPASEAPAAKPTKPKAAKIGDTITVKGMEDGEQLDVTVKKIDDPAKPKDEFFSPEAGNRWIGVQFELVNTGSKVYDDSPGNGTQVADSEGQRFSGVFADIKAGPSMASSVKLAPGDKALGWLVFEAPKASKIATVQFGMNSGFSDQTGQWKLQ
jgi:hypothetical protein